MQLNITDGFRRGFGRRSLWLAALVICLLGVPWAAAMPAQTIALAARPSGQIPLLAQSAYVKSDCTAPDDQFGTSVAVQGTTVVVGAPSEDSAATGVNGQHGDNGAPGSGAAYVYVLADNGWQQQAYLKASNTDAGDGFGQSVAISGDTLVIGAPGEDSAAAMVNGNQADNSAPNAGAAYVFVRINGIWVQQAYLKASNAEESDVLGWDVAIDGDTIVVAAIGEDSAATGVNGDQSNNGAVRAGAAYVFVRSAGVWSQQAYLKASNTDPNDRYGNTVDVEGDTIAVGAAYESSASTGVNSNQADNSLFHAGAVYVYVRNQVAWSQQAYVKPSMTHFSQQFAVVDISGELMAVGEEDKVYIFQRSGVAWAEKTALAPSIRDEFDVVGYGVALSGDTLVASSPYEDSAAIGIDGNPLDNSAADSGAAYVFGRSSETWGQRHYLKASNTGAEDNFGSSAALDGNIAVIGAHYEDSAATGFNGNGLDNSASNAGAVYVFDLAGNTAPVGVAPFAACAASGTPTSTATASTTPVTPTATAVTPTATQPPAATASATAVTPTLTATAATPTATQSPPTSTAVTPTATALAPTPTASATTVAPTATAPAAPPNRVYLPLLRR